MSFYVPKFLQGSGPGTGAQLYSICRANLLTYFARNSPCRSFGSHVLLLFAASHFWLKMLYLLVAYRQPVA